MLPAAPRSRRRRRLLAWLLLAVLAAGVAASAALALHWQSTEPGASEPLVALGFDLLLSVVLAALVHSQISARRRADDEVELRTAELRRTAAELRRVNAELEAHNREVEGFARLQRDFVATASHELRTPLTSIMGYLELVLDAPPEELSHEQRGHLQVVWRSAQRLLALVGDLLTVNRVDNGVMEVEPVPVAFGPLLAPAVHDLELACVAKGLRLSVADVATDLVVQADGRAPAPGLRQPDRQCDQVHAGAG